MEFQQANGQFGAAIKFYRPNVACTIQNAISRAGEHPVINIEMAWSKNFKPDWDNKLVVQVTMEELPRLCACALRMKRGVEYKFHGDGKNHGYSLHWNEDQLVLSASSPGRKHYLNFTPEEAFRFSDFVLERLHQGVTPMTKTDLMNLLHRTVRD